MFKLYMREPLGKLLDHWELLPLKRLIRPVSSGKVLIKGHLKPLADGVGYPAYSASGQDVRLLHSQFQGNGIVLSVVGAQCGKCFYASGEWGVVANTQPFFPTSHVNARFLFYMLNQTNFWEIGGAAQPYVQVSRSLSKVVSVPSLIEQVAIVRYLDHVDQRIRRYILAKEKLIKLLEEHRQVIIQQAVTGQVDVRTGKPYPVYNDTGNDGLRQVPEHWKMLQLKRLIRPVSAGAVLIKGHLKPLADGVGYPAYSASGQDVRLLHSQFQGNGIVLSAVGAQCGKCFYASGEWGVVANTQPFFPTSQANARFLFYILNQNNFWEIGGAAQPYVQVSRSLSKIVSVPSLIEQAAIVDFLRTFIKKTDFTINRNRHQITLLQEYRTRLISDVVNGIIDVRDMADELPKYDLPTDSDVDDIIGDSVDSDLGEHDFRSEETSQSV